MGTSKEPIRLRRRKMPSGLTSLYLDIYLNGKRTYEYLKLYLVPEKTRADKEKNRTTLQLAEDIRAKRMVELRNGEFGFKSMYKEDTLFYPYYRAMCEARLGEESRGNWGNWYSALHHLKIYDGNEKLTFRDITTEWVQGFKQKKTGGQEYLDINEQAAELLGERGKPQDLVFPYMISPDSQNSIIQQWVYKAGINKKITFHCGRHTFAVMMLDLGADLYTVSKLLGHKLIGTTQIYAKVLDKNKQAAVSRIPTIFGTPTEDTDTPPSEEENDTTQN